MYMPLQSPLTLPLCMPLPRGTRAKGAYDERPANLIRRRRIDLRSLHTLRIYGAEKPLEKSPKRVAGRRADLDRCDGVIREHLESVTVLELFKLFQFGVEFEGRLGGETRSKKERQRKNYWCELGNVCALINVIYLNHDGHMLRDSHAREETRIAKRVLVKPKGDNDRLPRVLGQREASTEEQNRATFPPSSHKPGIFHY